MPKKLEDDKAPEESKKESKAELSLSQILGTAVQEPELRTLTIIGDINEELSKDVMAALWYLQNNATVQELVDPEDPECEETKEVTLPIEVVISTNGGSADDMFAIYDLMRIVKTKCEISTIGLGKVMSAGVLILASGTKGLRKIGKNCRVMIHGVSCPAQYGSLASVENDIKEVKWIQDRYVECLHLQTDLTKKKILKMLNKQVDTYISAEEAIEYGIADIIV